MGGNAGNIGAVANPVGMLANAPVISPSNPTPSGAVNQLNKIGTTPTDGSGAAQENFGNQVLQSMSSLLPGITGLLSGGKGGPGAINTLGGALTPQPMNIPGITPIEQQAGSTISTNLAAGGDPRAVSMLNQVTGGDVGTSPATTAAMENFKKFTQPDIEQQMALAGLGRSGAAGEAVAQGSEQAYVPLVQTEIANKMAAAPELQQMGDAATSAAMGYGGLQRDISTQQQQAQLNDLMRRTGISEMLLGIPAAGISTALSGMFAPRTTTGGKGK